MREANVKTFILTILAALLFVNLPQGMAAEASNYPAQAGSVVRDQKMTVLQRVDGRTAVIRMGMTKASVDRLLGEPEAYRSPDGGDYYMYGDVMAGYMNGRLALFSLGEASTLASGVGVNSSLANASKKLGAPSVSNTLTYGYRWDAKSATLFQLKGTQELQRYAGRSDFYLLELSVNGLGDMYGIQLVRGDYAISSMERVERNNEALMPTEAAKPITMADLAVVQEGTQSRVTLGMTRKEAEAVIGMPIDESLFGITYDGIKVGYRKDRVVALMLQLTEAKTLYKTPRGAGLLTSRTVFEALYGQTEYTDESGLTYILIPEGTEGKLRTSMINSDDQLDIDNKKPAYIISTLFTESEGGLLEFLMICDAEYASTGK
ncbi:hypothetical protein [Paenibacillus methanolicus]|uniref:Copper amine oxidase-like protein n=1 Tax=Paenibacillus methanolicus TaxID=582686 RepID=A0A5S5C417_9BACL|nr:hypothetical protein [Paenibacillus methanolicus]TYP73232.1 hypothetical protein BCM02_107216 [Paenibacillus methanolicus]